MNMREKSEKMARRVNELLSDIDEVLSERDQSLCTELIMEISREYSTAVLLAAIVKLRELTHKMIAANGPYR